MRHASSLRLAFCPLLLGALLCFVPQEARAEYRSVAPVIQGQLLTPDDSQCSTVDYFLVVTHDSHMHCFDAQARERWTIPVHSPAKLLRADSEAIILTDHANVTSIAAASGTLLWTIQSDRNDNAQFLENFVAITNNQELKVFSANDGKLLWKLPGKNGQSARALASNSKRLVVQLPPDTPDARGVQLAVVDGATGHTLSVDRLSNRPQWVGMTQSGDVLVVDASYLFAAHRESPTPFQTVENVIAIPEAFPAIGTTTIATFTGESIRTSTLDGTLLNNIRVHFQNNLEPRHLGLLSKQRNLFVWTEFSSTDNESFCIDMRTGTLAWRPTIPPESSIKAAAFGESVFALALESNDDGHTHNLAVAFYDLTHAGFLTAVIQLEAPATNAASLQFDSLTFARNTAVASANQHIYAIPLPIEH